MTSPNAANLDGNPRHVELSARAGGEMDGTAEASPADFLDPTFISDLVNAFYAEGRPPALTMGAAGVAEGNAAALLGAAEVAEQRAISTTNALAGIDPGDESLAALLTGLRSEPATAAGGTRLFYFLRAPEPAPLPTKSSRAFPVEAIRADFPILQQKVHGKPLIWLDNAATTQKPRMVIETVARFYERDNSNIHRAQHTLAMRATDLYETARDKVRHFLGAATPEEIVFTHGATEAINLVAQSFGRKNIRKGDEIVISTIEHHANIVPWQQLVEENEAVLRVIPVNDRGEILLEEYEKLLGPRTRMVAITHASNAVGTILPVRMMTQLAHRHGARVLIDGAQSVPHMPVDVQTLDCDFYVFAGHKLFGPTGVGVLYGKRDLLDAMPPWQGGGNMMEEVTFERTTYRRTPAKFEAGTAILAGAIGLGAAIDYVDDLGMENVNRYEQELLGHATEALSAIPGLRLIGTASEKIGVLSFVVEGTRPENLGRFLDREAIAVRVGRHCAHPTMKRFGVASTVRASLALYNTQSEIDVLAEAIQKARAIF